MVDFHRRAGQGGIRLALLAMLAFPLRGAWAAATELEVFHYLDTRADVQRVAVLRDAMKSSGSAWKDFTVTNGWTGRGESLLRLRVQSHNAPSSAMMKTPFMQQWAAGGALLPLDEVAAAQRWDEVLPKPIADTVKYKGRYYAVPLNVHRVNWLSINERILKEAGAQAPTTWEEFFVTAEAMKRAGYAAVAYYGRETQNLLMFEIIALGIGGPQFHRKALVEYDPAELTGPVMEQVLRTYRRIKDYTEQPASARVSMARGWSKFQTGEVGMHLMGDWANPAFYPPDRPAPFKSLCVPAPGSAASFLFTSDSLAMFRSPDPAVARGQQAFAGALMAPGVQHDYSLRKGSIPARAGIDLERYHGCAQKNALAFRAAAQAGTLLPAMSMTASRALEDAIQEVVTEYWNDDRLTTQQAMSRLVAATRRATRTGQ